VIQKTWHPAGFQDGSEDTAYHSSLLASANGAQFWGLVVLIGPMMLCEADLESPAIMYLWVKSLAGALNHPI
jgi:hypothetical protein